MCSNSRCDDVAGLIQGPVGQLLKIGIEKLVERATTTTPSVSQNANVRISREKENIEKFYDTVEAHLHGTLRVLQPALEINRIIFRECKSAGYEKLPGKSCETESLAYYTPQNVKCRSRPPSVECRRYENSRNRRCEPVSTCQQQSLHQLSDDHRHYTADAERLKYKKSIPKMCFSPASSKKIKNNRDADDGETTDEEYEKSSRKTRTSKKQKCSICSVKLKNISLLAKLPCGHLFCYPCLSKLKCRNCQICDKFFTTKTITDIERKSGPGD